MAEYIKKSDLEKHIIREGCDEGCGYIDERDLKNIPTYEVYGTEEVMAMLEKLKSEIILQVIDEPIENGTITEMASFNSGIVGSYDLIQQKIDKMKGE